MSICKFFGHLLYKCSELLTRNRRISDTIHEFEYFWKSQFDANDIKSFSFTLKDYKLTLKINPASTQEFIKSFDSVFTPDMLGKLGRRLVAMNYSVSFYCDTTNELCRLDVFIPYSKKKAR